MLPTNPLYWPHFIVSFIVTVLFAGRSYDVTLLLKAPPPMRPAAITSLLSAQSQSSPFYPSFVCPNLEFSSSLPSSGLYDDVWMEKMSKALILAPSLALVAQDISFPDSDRKMKTLLMEVASLDENHLRNLGQDLLTFLLLWVISKSASWIHSKTSLVTAWYDDKTDVEEIHLDKPKELGNKNLQAQMSFNIYENGTWMRRRQNLYIVPNKQPISFHRTATVDEARTSPLMTIEGQKRRAPTGSENSSSWLQYKSAASARANNSALKGKIPCLFPETAEMLKTLTAKEKGFSFSRPIADTKIPDLKLLDEGMLRPKLHSQQEVIQEKKLLEQRAVLKDEGIENKASTSICFAEQTQVDFKERHTRHQNFLQAEAELPVEADCAKSASECIRTGREHQVPDCIFIRPTQEESVGHKEELEKALLGGQNLEEDEEKEEIRKQHDPDRKEKEKPELKENNQERDNRADIQDGHDEDAQRYHESGPQQYQETLSMEAEKLMVILPSLPVTADIGQVPWSSHEAAAIDNAINSSHALQYSTVDSTEHGFAIPLALPANSKSSPISRLSASNDELQQRTLIHQNEERETDTQSPDGIDEQTPEGVKEDHKGRQNLHKEETGLTEETQLSGVVVEDTTAKEYQVYNKGFAGRIQEELEEKTQWKEHENENPGMEHEQELREEDKWEMIGEEQNWGACLTPQECYNTGAQKNLERHSQRTEETSLEGMFLEETVLELMEEVQKAPPSLLVESRPILLAAPAVVVSDPVVPLLAIEPHWTSMSDAVLSLAAEPNDCSQPATVREAMLGSPRYSSQASESFANSDITRLMSLDVEEAILSTHFDHEDWSADDEAEEEPESEPEAQGALEAELRFSNTSLRLGQSAPSIIGMATGGVPPFIRERTRGQQMMRFPISLYPRVASASATQHSPLSFSSSFLAAERQAFATALDIQTGRHVTAQLLIRLDSDGYIASSDEEEERQADNSSELPSASLASKIRNLVTSRFCSLFHTHTLSPSAANSVSAVRRSVHRDRLYPDSPSQLLTPRQRLSLSAARRNAASSYVLPPMPF